MTTRLPGTRRQVDEGGTGGAQQAGLEEAGAAPLAGPVTTTSQASAQPQGPRMNSCQGSPHPCCTISPTAQDLRWGIGCTNGPDFPPSLNPCPVLHDSVVALAMETVYFFISWVYGL